MVHYAHALMMDKYDIVIVGGGLAGLSQALLIAQQGWRVACIDRDDPQVQTTHDTRTTAISYGSRNVLRHAGIWADMESVAEPITDIAIKDDDSPVALEFNVADIDADAFGWIVDNRDLRHALINHVEAAPNITHMTGQTVTRFEPQSDHVTVTLADNTTLQARLVIGADGRNSFTREAMGIGVWEHDYKQHAIVCILQHEKPHHGYALEHFRPTGPFAVLPFTDTADGKHQSALVWTVAPQDSAHWVQCDEILFNAAVQERCSDRYGTVTVSGNRAAWPLNVKKAYNYIGARMVLIAEAAHGMHPIAGQGLNMSLRDVAAIVEVLKNAHDPGDPAVLEKYQRMRRADNLAMVVATDRLNSLFESRMPIMRAARRFGLHAVSRLPVAKQFFMRQAMGVGGHLPALVRDAA